MAKRIYARLEDLDGIKKDIEGIHEDIRDIRDNHLCSIRKQIKNLQWFIMGSFAVVAIVLAILDVFGK